MMDKKKLILLAMTMFTIACLAQNPGQLKKEVTEVLRAQVMKEAAWALQQEPVTVTATSSERSAGTKHDFFSEADYFWPDTTNLDGPYVNRDGMTNPNNFVAHRHAMIRLSRIIGALASAYTITHDKRYVLHAMKHLRAWFIDPETKMNPNLQFSQAIKGRATGRNYGIIDTIHLMEVAQGARVMENAKDADNETISGTKKWFGDYLRWLTTHPYGIDEMNTKNNHSTCWVMQVASFARLTENDSLLDVCRERYKTILLPNQMGEDGSFPLEIKRTKPYGYSIFNLDAMTMVCKILSDKTHDLWNFTLPDGRSIKKGIAFLYPFVKDKSAWPYGKDVMYWDNWPVAQPAFLFGALEFKNRDWLETWKQLDHEPTVEEVIRNLPIRNPLIWID
jgi:hypothetical protein